MAEIAGLADGQVERHRGVGVPIRGHGELAAQHEVGVTLAPVGERADLLPAGIVRIRADGRRAHRAGQFQIAERPNGALATVDKRLHRLDALGDLLEVQRISWIMAQVPFGVGVWSQRCKGKCYAWHESRVRQAACRVAIMSAPVPSTLATMTWPICTGAVVSTACSRRRISTTASLGTGALERTGSRAKSYCGRLRWWRRCAAARCVPGWRTPCRVCRQSRAPRRLRRLRPLLPLSAAERAADA